MKAIQITMDDALLADLDADEEVRRDGRSAVLRRAATQYLQRKHRAAIAAAYRRGYGSGTGSEFEGWADESAWPDE